MASLMRRIEKAHGTNTLRHGSRPTSADRVVVLPSPDLVYSIGVFDLSSGPLRITAPASQSYMSLSLYAANTDNFFVMNDRQAEGGKFDLILVGPGASDPGVEGVRLVRSPSQTGIILFRFFAPEGAPLDEIDALRRQIACTVLQ
jgi:uncharacterized membrane protein